MADLTKRIEQLRDDLQTSEADLVTAKEAASRVPEIEGEIERLQAAMTALGAPQSPSGRKRIAEAQKKRTRGPKAEALNLTEPLYAPVDAAPEPRCYECKATGSVPPCPGDSCEVNVCVGCLPKHNKRRHSEGAA